MDRSRHTGEALPWPSDACRLVVTSLLLYQGTDEALHGGKLEEPQHASTRVRQPEVANAPSTLPKPVLREATSTGLAIEWPSLSEIPPHATQLHVYCQPCDASEHLAGTVDLTATSAFMPATRAWYRFRLKWADEWDFPIGSKGPWSERMYRIVTVRVCERLRLQGDCDAF